MKAREIALDSKTAALGSAIAQLGKLPETLGKQTSQYIAMGVRQSIQDDFSRPIAEAVKGPIAELSRETYHARIVMEQVGKEVRFQSWTWVAVLLLLGFAFGGAAGYYLFVRDMNAVSDRLDVIQQQLTPAAAVPDAKPVDGKAGKGHRGGH
jgi:uncharacterized protein YfaQ (DUF2300 family)